MSKQRILLTAVLLLAAGATWTACDEKLSTLAGPTPNLAPTFATIQSEIFEKTDSTGRVACTNCQRESGGKSRHCNSIGRNPVAARHASTSCVCSAMWRWIGTSSSPTSRTSSAMEIPEAARNEWMATPALTRARRED